MGKYVCYNEVSLVSLCRGSFPHILLFLRQRISFVIPTTSFSSGSLYQGST